jgi:arylformamidase
MKRTRHIFNPREGHPAKPVFSFFRALPRALLMACFLAGTKQPVASQTPVQTALPPTLAEVAYGSQSQQVLDFWQAKGPGPTPLILNIHGGGWLHGKKDPLGRDQKYLERGISVVHITYRFTPANPLPSPVMDAARALQFVRSKAVEWNIDPKRVIVSGFSAGGCSALWLATHDDLADPDSSDPVERESTRVSGAMVVAAQTTIEPDKVRDWVGAEAIKHPMMRSAFGFKTNEEMFEAFANSPEIARLYREFSPINHLSLDDPPVLLEYGEISPAKNGDIHGAEFGVEFKKQADALEFKNCWLRTGKDARFSGYPGGQMKFVEMIFKSQNPVPEDPSKASLQNNDPSKAQ